MPHCSILLIVPLLLIKQPILCKKKELRDGDFLLEAQKFRVTLNCLFALFPLKKYKHRIKPIKYQSLNKLDPRLEETL